jgi:hypothetical protein
MSFIVWLMQYFGLIDVNALPQHSYTDKLPDIILILRR